MQRLPNPNPVGRGSPSLALAQWGCAGRAARVFCRGNDEVPPHPGRIKSHPRFGNPLSILPRLEHGGIIHDNITYLVPGTSTPSIHYMDDIPIETGCDIFKVRNTTSI